jgi:hypothetical protein
MLVGAILSVFVLYMLSDNPSGATVALGMVAGTVIGHAVWRATRR